MRFAGTRIEFPGREAKMFRESKQVIFDEILESTRRRKWCVLCIQFTGTRIGFSGREAKMFRGSKLVVGKSHAARKCFLFCLQFLFYLRQLFLFYLLLLFCWCEGGQRGGRSGEKRVEMATFRHW